MMPRTEVIVTNSTTHDNVYITYADELKSQLNHGLTSIHCRHNYNRVNITPEVLSMASVSASSMNRATLETLQMLIQQHNVEIYAERCNRCGHVTYLVFKNLQCVNAPRPTIAAFGSQMIFASESLQIYSHENNHQNLIAFLGLSEFEYNEDENNITFEIDVNICCLDCSTVTYSTYYGPVEISFQNVYNEKTIRTLCSEIENYLDRRFDEKEINGVVSQLVSRQEEHSRYFTINSLNIDTWVYDYVKKLLTSDEMLKYYDITPEDEDLYTITKVKTNTC